MAVPSRSLKKEQLQQAGLGRKKNLFQQQGQRNWSQDEAKRKLP